jgi:hypothetical protein
MTDTDKLKRLAEAAIDEVCNWECDSKAGSDFIAAANPQAIRDLIAENERMKECATGPAAWLARWGRHVGNCRADDGMRECTCGLDLARYDLARIDAAE